MKKFSLKLLVLSLIFCLFVSNFAIASSALSYGPFDELVWDGSGDISANVEFDHGAFAGLELFGHKINETNYTVSGTDKNTVITLKEDFLKSFNLNNGKYIFWAGFNKEHLQVFEHKFDKITKDEISIPITTNDGKFYKLSINGEDVDSANYTIDPNYLSDLDKRIIKLNEDFYKTLPENSSAIVYTSIDDLKAQFLLDIQISNNENTKPQPYIGDLNGDGKLTSADARICLRLAAKLDIPTSSQAYAADVFADGEITAKNARLILRASAKLENLPGRDTTMLLGDILVLEPLKGSGSTPYKWECNVAPSEGLEVYEETVFPVENSDEIKDGESSYLRYAFAAETTGDYTVNLKHVSLDGKEIIEEITFNISVIK